MGDFFQSVVDLETTEDQAPEVADKVVEWLVAEGFVGPTRTDCVLGEESGRPPGPRHPEIVETTDAFFLTTRTNGMHAEVGRTVFDAGQGGVESVRCPSCGEVDRLHDDDARGPTDRWPAFTDAIGSWYEGGSGEVTCAHCGRDVGLNDWGWDPPWAFGCLGFTFWNWPPLRDSFVAEVARLLGHRVAVVVGKR